jgi:hypothetical protein
MDNCSKDEFTPFRGLGGWVTKKPSPSGKGLELLAEIYGKSVVVKSGQFNIIECNTSAPYQFLLFGYLTFFIKTTFDTENPFLFCFTSSKDTYYRAYRQSQ